MFVSLIACINKQTKTRSNELISVRSMNVSNVHYYKFFLRDIAMPVKKSYLFNIHSNDCINKQTKTKSNET